MLFKKIDAAGISVPRNAKAVGAEIISTFESEGKLVGVRSNESAG